MTTSLAAALRPRLSGWVSIVGAALLLAPPTAAAGPILDVAGTTLGCFGTDCNAFGSPVTHTSDDYDLTFTGTAFAVTTDASGSANHFSLGTMTRGQVNTDENAPDLDFTLQVTFSLPLGMTGGQSELFTALITGTSANGGGGPTPIDFDNTWYLFTFLNAAGSGSFEFSVVNDPEVNKNSDRSGNGALILGGIRNSTFTPTQDPPSDAPEPGTTLMLAAGTALLAYRRQSRRA